MNNGYWIQYLLAFLIILQNKLQQPWLDSSAIRHVTGVSPKAMRLKITHPPSSRQYVLSGSVLKPHWFAFSFPPSCATGFVTHEVCVIRVTTWHWTTCLGVKGVRVCGGGGWSELSERVGHTSSMTPTVVVPCVASAFGLKMWTESQPDRCFPADGYQNPYLKPDNGQFLNIVEVACVFH